MQVIDLEHIINNLTPISTDHRYSLAWSSGGVIGIRELATCSPLVTLRENHGAILRSGFSSDMQQLVSANEDGTYSIWFIKSDITPKGRTPQNNIVDYICDVDLVPYLNINPKSKAHRYHFMLKDVSYAMYDWYDWQDCQCPYCAWYSPCREPGWKSSDPSATSCSRGSKGCNYKSTRLAEKKGKRYHIR